jgi:hypothetical protein
MIWATLTKSKDELLELAKYMWSETGEDGRPLMCNFVDQIGHTEAALKAFMAMLKSGESRLLAASSKLEALGEL